MKSKIQIIGFFILSAYTSCFGAPAPPPTGGAACWPPPCIPIDGGISLLIAAGVLYGGSKLYSKQKNKKTL
jgi:hypothetical protein